MDTFTDLQLFSLYQIINESLEEVNAPVRVVSGFVGRVTVTVPWTSLMSSSCTVMVSGLTITVTPHSTAHQTGGQSELLLSILAQLLNIIFLFDRHND